MKNQNVETMDAPIEENGPSLGILEKNSRGLSAIEKAEMLQDFQQTVEVQSAATVEKAAQYADTLIKGLLSQVKEELKGIGKPKMLWVKIDDTKPIKLTSPASKILPRLIQNSKCGLNTLLVGPAGSGKTFVSQQLAEALNLEFSSVCFTAGASETWLFGRQTPNGFIEGPFPKRFRDGGVFLGDEFDAADSNMLLCVNTALANGILYNPINGETIKRHENFVFVAGANTIGMGSNAAYTGRNRLDAATLDRFVKIRVDYDPDVEELLCPEQSLREQLQAARKVLLEQKTDWIISPRGMDYAYRQFKQGVPLKEIFDSLTMGWPEELIRKTGLDRIETKVKTPKKKEKQEATESTVKPEDIF